MSPLTRRHLFAAFAASTLTSAADTPKRGGRVLSTRPQDYEMGMDGFLEYLTPNDRFYVRSHHYTPTLRAADYKLTVDGEVGQTLTLSLDDLKKMPKTELVSVCECAGNGRSLYNPGMPGLQWEHGSVGNARWGGVRLADVLKRAGAKPTTKFVHFDGADVPVGKMPDFQRGIPAAKAMHPDTLLAYEMNGQELPVSHGFPLRVVVPGWAGDSWVKWVTKITAMEKEADVFFMKTGYRHPGKAVTPGVPVDPAQMHPVEKINIKSVIATPVADAGVKPGTPVRIAGAAWAGGGVPVAGVEVSVDRGRTWRPATLGAEKHTYGWRLWNFEWKPAATGHYILMARARTATGETQPFEPEWNPSGYLWNVVHRVPVHVSDNPAEPPAPKGWPPVPTPGAPASFKQTCNGCHDDTVIVQQRLTRAQWDREITKMTGWGAPVKPDQRNEILDFLVSRFGR